MDNYIAKLRQFEGVITTDYSMLPELLPAQNIWNCTRNRIAAYKLQQEGINIIPTASWSGLEDFDWCLDGLPNDSSIAISTNGSKATPYGKRIFTEGVDILQERICPRHLIICGREMPKLQEKYDNIVYYPSFSQRWKERECNGYRWFNA